MLPLPHPASGDAPLRAITLYLDDGVYRGLSKEAAESGHTIPEKAQQIINASVPSLPPDASEPQTGKEFLDAIRAIVDPIGGIELEIPPRGCCDHVCPGRPPL